MDNYPSKRRLASPESDSSTNASPCKSSSGVASQYKKRRLLDSSHNNGTTAPLSLFQASSISGTPKSPKTSLPKRNWQSHRFLGDFTPTIPQRRSSKQLSDNLSRIERSVANKDVTKANAVRQTCEMLPMYIQFLEIIYSMFEDIPEHVKFALYKYSTVSKINEVKSKIIGKLLEVGSQLGKAADTSSPTAGPSTQEVLMELLNNSMSTQHNDGDMEATNEVSIESSPLNQMFHTPKNLSFEFKPSISRKNVKQRSGSVIELEINNAEYSRKDELAEVKNMMKTSTSTIGLNISDAVDDKSTQNPSNLSEISRQSIIVLSDDDSLRVDDKPHNDMSTDEVIVVTSPTNRIDVSTEAYSVSKQKYDGMGEFQPGTHNDGITGEFDGTHYPHSKKMFEVLKETFGLPSFRPNQLQVINAALQGHNCFVLMPTGGGKSLCYQMAAVLTEGVTIVISPLKSLILDQTNKLKSLGIPADHISGDHKSSNSSEIYRDLCKSVPTLKVLYVTPEKVVNSQHFQHTLDLLYKNGNIARFVIDEAHCVSQWGHDFRKDYQRLKSLRVRYPDTNVMALTATATPRVKLDVVNLLNMADCKWFLTGFNRPNLVYSVTEKKPKTVDQDIIKMIKDKFMGKSGIVYCLSRDDCDGLAKSMAAAGIKAAPYHAGLTDSRRAAVHGGWIDNKYHVICATIAFGMGVDKADVRFVIHHSIPKSIEGYYQESGRAGRDGNVAHCIIFYCRGDISRQRRFYEKDKTMPAAAKKVHMDNLLHMVSLCERVECRRVLMLAYLGEKFDPALCKRNKETACDACLSDHQYEPLDVTETCRTIVKCVRSVNSATRAHFTLIHLSLALKGSTVSRLSSLQNTPIHGRLRSWDRNEITRLLTFMVVKEYLMEKVYFNNDMAATYIVEGQHARLLFSGSARVMFPKSGKVPLTRTSNAADGASPHSHAGQATTKKSSGTGARPKKRAAIENKAKKIVKVAGGAKKVPAKKGSSAALWSPVAGPSGVLPATAANATYRKPPVAAHALPMPKSNLKSRPGVLKCAILKKL